jgi:hypothetical protein
MSFPRSPPVEDVLLWFPITLRGGSLDMFRSGRASVDVGLLETLNDDVDSGHVALYILVGTVQSLSTPRLEA